MEEVPSMGAIGSKLMALPARSVRLGGDVALRVRRLRPCANCANLRPRTHSHTHSAYGNVDMTNAFGDENAGAVSGCLIIR